MDLPQNPFKRALQKGELQIGLWCTLASHVAVDMISDSGFDWLVLDAEHGPSELPDLLCQLQAARGGTAIPMVRPPANDTVLIKRVLDIGAQSLLLPFVQSAEEARAAVAATRYPPDGVRGVTGSGRASRYGRVPGYIGKAHEEICVIVQVETRAALDQLEAIAAVEGVDGVFIGPADLSTSFGYQGNWKGEEMQAVLKDAARRLKAVGTPAGILTSDEAEARRFMEWGYSFVALGTDLGLLRNTVDALARRFKG